MAERMSALKRTQAKAAQPTTLQTPQCNGMQLNWNNGPDCLTRLLSLVCALDMKQIAMECTQCNFYFHLSAGILTLSYMVHTITMDRANGYLDTKVWGAILPATLVFSHAERLETTKQERLCPRPQHALYTPLTDFVVSSQTLTISPALSLLSISRSKCYSLPQKLAQFEPL